MIVTLSAVDQAYLKTRLNVPETQVVHSGVDLDYFRRDPELQEVPNSLLFVGYFRHPPNVEGLYYFFNEIWPEIINEVSNAKITIIGRFPPPELLAYRQKDSVVFTESVPDLRPHLQQHNVFVAPIIGGAGLRGKILEAMAMQKAVVATQRCMEGYSFEHDRELMIAGDGREFARHTIELLRTPGKRERLGRNARLRIEAEFGTDRFTQSYEKLHQELCQ
jgi:glycosyltransferase involved in cell wall biosynthesis